VRNGYTCTGIWQDWVSWGFVELRGLGNEYVLQQRDGTPGIPPPVRESEVLAPSAMIAISDSIIPDNVMNMAPG
jgi:hypothetical protein